jgi:hypothetical protein
MSRRRRKNQGSNVGLAIVVLLGLYLVSMIIEFISENINEIVTIIAIILGIVLFFYVLKGLLYFKKINDYKKTEYYRDTKMPYTLIKKNVGLQFEADVYNSLKQKFPDALLLTNLLIARKGSVNEYSEIDLIFFYYTGIYVLELKNYNGFVYGDMNKDNWTVGYKNNTKRTTYEFLNPIMQNNKHIEDLKKVTEYDYINHVIFSNKTQIDSFIDNVSNLERFIETVSSEEKIYTIDELRNSYEFIKKINTYEKLDKHIERIKFNEQKYSNYKKI